MENRNEGIMVTKTTSLPLLCALERLTAHCVQRWTSVVAGLIRISTTAVCHRTCRASL